MDKTLIISLVVVAVIVIIALAMLFYGIKKLREGDYERTDYAELWRKAKLAVKIHEKRKRKG